MRRIRQYFDEQFDQQRAALSMLHKVISDSHESTVATLQHSQETLAHDVTYKQRIAQLEAQNAAKLFSLQRAVDEHILVAGFFGATNLGDELMLEALLEHIEEIRPRAQITVLISHNYNFDLTRYGRCDFIHYPSSSLEIDAIASFFDTLITAGGALIDDDKYDMYAHPMSLETILIQLSMRFNSLGKRCLLYGLSTSEKLHSQEYLHKLRRIMKDSHHFSLRDTNSQKTLAMAGIKQSPTIVDDMVLSHQAIKSPPVPLQKNSRSTEIGLIFIYNDETLPVLTRFVEKLLSSTSQSTTFRLIPFYDYHDHDIHYGEKMLTTLSNKRLKMGDKLYNFQDTTAYINAMDSIISMRYHGTLLSNALGKRTICINYTTHSHYNNKNLYLYSHYGFTKIMYDFSALDAVTIDELSRDLRKRTKKVDMTKVQANASGYVRAILQYS